MRHIAPRTARNAIFHVILFVASSGLTRANRVQRFARVRSLMQPCRQSIPAFGDGINDRLLLTLAFVRIWFVGPLKNAIPAF